MTRMSERVVLATANLDKAREIRSLLEAAGLPVELVPRPVGVADVEETATTLEENARLKAAALTAATGLPAIADDTGLLVAALGGAPGVVSARYAGEHASYDDNVAKLLAEMRAIPDRDRHRGSKPWPSLRGRTDVRWWLAARWRA